MGRQQVITPLRWRCSVRWRSTVGMFRFLELQNHLELLLGCSVDLGTPRSLKRGMRDRVLSEAVEIG